MKKILLLSAMFATVGSFAQVGINTADPKATLDVTIAGTEPAKGLLIPRLSAEEVKTMTDAGSVGTEQNSMMVYITSAFTDTADKTGKYENIDTTGYYYWDAEDNGGKWKKILSQAYAAGAGITLNGNEFSRTGIAKGYLAFNGFKAPYWYLLDEDTTKNTTAAMGAINLSTYIPAPGLTIDEEPIGIGSNAYFSTAIGQNNRVNSESSVVIGIRNRALGLNNDLLIGSDLTSTYRENILLGRYITTGSSGVIAIGNNHSLGPDTGTPNAIALGTGITRIFCCYR
ncbi:hypothetical protein MWN41_02210 [Ornithobacterium rhinotracheale]|uniref:hypothetical protein n=1 Tax=Ornithobacterium rhinotracheale TaxID=28251 RepID=UPI001FF6C98D|nr:hypothetical protein [Ornithobacterium rhinotracheale]MCK0201831.1 hypothetical protein [Ornithobacterium rhinotracheale]